MDLQLKQTGSFPGSDSFGIEVRVKFTEIVLIQVGFQT